MEHNNEMKQPINIHTHSFILIHNNGRENTDKISKIHDILTATILPPCHQMIYDIVFPTTKK